ncbi:MAG: SDR family oxidoreductase [Pseudomonadota bacterium]
MSGLLAGHRILVTGAAGTIGRAVVSAVAAEGGTPIGADIAQTAWVDYLVDVTSEAEWARVVEGIEAEHGQLDGLVTAAGIIHVASLQDTTYADFRRVMSINVDGTFLACKAMWPLLQRSSAPSIVTVSSVSGIVGGAKFAAYNASKGAVRLLTKSMALSGAREQPAIRANSVHPAFVEGEMVDGIAAKMREPAKGHEKMRSMVPLGRFAEPAEIATTIVGLLSPASAFTTGAEIVLDGGLTAE